jgi:hypothetical protein
MWLRRGKRGNRLSRQLALAQLEDAMGRVQDPQEQSAEQTPTVPAPRRGGLIPERLARLARRRSA